MTRLLLHRLSFGPHLIRAQKLETVPPKNELLPITSVFLSAVSSRSNLQLLLLDIRSQIAAVHPISFVEFRLVDSLL